MIGEDARDPKLGELWIDPLARTRDGRPWRVDKVEPDVVVFRDPADPHHAIYCGRSQPVGWRRVEESM